MIAVLKFDKKEDSLGDAAVEQTLLEDVESDAELCLGLVREEGPGGSQLCPSLIWYDEKRLSGALLEEAQQADEAVDLFPAPLTRVMHILFMSE
jgi:hypothetical protein